MSSLWLGEDHLVYARGRGFLFPFTEEYRRYRYADIQAFSLVKTSRLGLGLVYGFGLSLAVGVLVLLAIFGRGDSFGPAVAITAAIFSIIGLGLLALLLRHLVLGPTCLCDIQTSLSQQRILPLDRYHRARQLIEEIGVKIDESQSGLVGRENAESTVLASTAVSDFYRVPALVVPAFLVIAVTGVLCLVAMHLASILLVAVAMLSLLAVSVLLLISLIQSVRQATPQSVRTALWVATGLLFVLIGTGIIYFLAKATANPEYTLGIEGPLRAFTQIAPGGGIVFYTLFLVLTAGLSLPGIVGLVEAFRWKRKLGNEATGPAESSIDLAGDE